MDAPKKTAIAHSTFMQERSSTMLVAEALQNSSLFSLSLSPLPVIYLADDDAIQVSA